MVRTLVTADPGAPECSAVSPQRSIPDRREGGTYVASVSNRQQVHQSLLGRGTNREPRVVERSVELLDRPVPFHHIESSPLDAATLKHRRKVLSCALGDEERCTRT